MSATGRSFSCIIAVGLCALGVPQPAAGAILAAWVQLTGPGRDASLRVITDDPRCPDFQADGDVQRMETRAEPGPLFSGRGDLPEADFPVRVCEASVPPGTTRVKLAGKAVPIPRPDIRRIVIFGDTGCRIKKKKTQDCNDPDEWPYARLAAHAAEEARPDLVIHVGDYLYREKPCKGRATKCPNSPTGYGWDIWDLDFFAPSKPLFAAAPWIMVRGNHETCRRAGEGWFRFLDRSPPQTSCGKTSPSFVAALGAIGFVVMDSAAVADASKADDEDDDDDDDEAGQTGGLTGALADNYRAIVSAIPPDTWVLTHAPFKGVRVDRATGETDTDNTILQEAVGSLLSASIVMIVSGHIHMFEAINFADGSPPQLVVGTGGDKLAKQPDEPSEVAGIQVAKPRPLILKNFGYMVWERTAGNGQSWNGKLIGTDGRAFARCQLAGRQLACAKMP
jgi:hypothetical protein